MDNLQIHYQTQQNNQAINVRHSCHYLSVTVHIYLIMEFEFGNEMENLLDIDIKMRVRKTISDILSPAEAIKAGKSSKNHKLKRRQPTKDRTKTVEARTKAVSKRSQVDIKMQ